MASRVLFVDDEPGIRETMQSILTMHGFEVVQASTVAEALQIIAASPFDVLISDLNIGSPGDGFTVVSAMRRTHPDCRTFILTGYPAFESALQAIRSQVDDYLIKPAHIPEMIRMIQDKLSAPRIANQLAAFKRCHDVIRENAPQISARLLAALQTQPELVSLGHSDERYAAPLELLLEELARCLEQDVPPDSSSLRELFAQGSRPASQMAAAWYGYLRRLQGYSLPLVVRSARLLEDVVYDVLNENLLTMEISSLLPDMKRLNHLLASQLEARVKSYLETHDRQLVYESTDRWSGWLCERCCWNRPDPTARADRRAATAAIHAEFEAHDCERFARENWKVAS